MSLEYDSAKVSFTVKINKKEKVVVYSDNQRGSYRKEMTPNCCPLIFFVIINWSILLLFQSFSFSSGPFTFDAQSIFVYYGYRDSFSSLLSFYKFFVYGSQKSYNVGNSLSESKFLVIDMQKSWVNNKQFMCKSWTSHVQIICKS